MFLTAPLCSWSCGPPFFSWPLRATFQGDRAAREPPPCNGGAQGAQYEPYGTLRPPYLVSFAAIVTVLANKNPFLYFHPYAFPTLPATLLLLYSFFSFSYSSFFLSCPYFLYPPPVPRSSWRFGLMTSIIFIKSTAFSGH